ncbi:MAG: hypothetical protein QOJ39_3664 [Candidatus Eremiobacteraeota bacterium]|jgi:hypothetical protein|nr:hypothetical protein [Candidatus Eremiobacteraeota bacterium]
MNAFQKIAAFAIAGAAAALLAPATPSQAQTQRVAPSGVYDPRAVPPECCTPTMKPLVTNATWFVQKPATGSTPQPASPLNALAGGWHAAFPGSQWIGPDPNAGANSMEPSGDYLYTYHFCLCALPPHVTTMPAALYLSIFGDNYYTVSLNGNTQPGWTNNPTTTSLTFTTQFNIMGAPAGWFQPGDNVLQIKVHNTSMYTGLDVSGWLSGYFRQLAPGERCKHGGPRSD